MHVFPMVLQHISACFLDLWDLICGAVQQEEDKVVFILSQGVDLHVREPVSQDLMIKGLAHILRTIIHRVLQLG